MLRMTEMKNKTVLRTAQRGGREGGFEGRRKIQIKINRCGENISGGCFRACMPFLLDICWISVGLDELSKAGPLNDTSQNLEV